MSGRYEAVGQRVLWTLLGECDRLVILIRLPARQDLDVHGGVGVDAKSSDPTEFDMALLQACVNGEVELELGTLHTTPIMILAVRSN